MTNQLAGEALSKAVAVAYGIEAFEEISEPEEEIGGGFFQLRTFKKWLHKDSGRCFELAVEYGLCMEFDKYPYVSAMNFNRVVDSYSSDLGKRDVVSTRTAILLCLLAMREGK